MIRRLGYYIRTALRFYDIKGDWIAPAVFIAILLIGSIDNLISVRAVDRVLPSALNSLVHMTVVNFIAAIYLYAFISDLNNRVCNFREILSFIRRSGARIALASFIVSLLLLPATFIASYAMAGPEVPLSSELKDLLLHIFTATLLLAVYAVVAIILYLRYLLFFCYMTDKKLGIIDALKASAKRTRGHRAEIFAIIIVFNILLFFAAMFLVTFASSFQSILIFSFITLFGTTIFGLVQQRMIALIYFDLEYAYAQEDGKGI